MSKKRIVKLALFLAMAFIFNGLIIKYCNLENDDITLAYNVESEEQDIYQVFYETDIGISEEKSQKVIYKDSGKEQELEFTIPRNTKQIRLDLGTKSAEIVISNVRLKSYGKSIDVNFQSIINSDNKSEVQDLANQNNGIMVTTNGNDPYIYVNLDENSTSLLEDNFYVINLGLKVFLCAITDLVLFIFLRKSKSLLSLALEVKNNKSLIWNLSKNDFKTKYAGSYLGITWAFVQPIVTIVVYWFVFEFGLKAGSPMTDVPFVVWFISGLIPWFFFQESLLNATNCMMEYSYLVKKVVFKISILPIVKIISASFVHLVFLGFLFVVAGLYGFYPSQYSIQVIYYSFCIFCLTLAISYATSAMIIFFKDLGQLINIFLQVGMWMTPIMWSYTIVPGKFQWIVKLNPMYYIAEGYRDTFINRVWFFERYFQTVYFWIITSVLFVIGAVIFKKLKPHFADVL
ncbi:ABC transporter permease [Clostridium sp. ZBS17]|uniref:ABC transporter permease n=1 Tax=Clostridium sp. ZBS17 TaxID=2949968 RepID=UPI00207AB17E|nr:ABC transporter permease [Clostridium sp. ZBS17]